MANFSVAIQTERAQKTIVYYLAFIGLGMVAASLGPTVRELAKQTDTSMGDIGVLLTVRAMAYLVGSLLVGRLYDRYTGHRIMIGSVIVLFVVFLFVPTTPYLWLLVVLLFIVGLGESGLDVGGNTLLLWTHGEKVGPFMNGLHFFFGVGAFIAPIVVALSLDLTDGIAWAYWIIGVSLLPLILLFSRQRSPQAHTADNAQSHGKEKPNFRLIGLAILFLVFYVGVELGFGNWIYTYAVERDLLSKTDAAYLNSAFWGAFTLGRLLGIPIAIRFVPRTILFGSLVGTLASLLFMLALQEVAFLWIGTIGFGFSIAPIFPTTLAFVERRTVMTGQITSLFFVAAGAGAMVIPWSIGALMDSQGDEIMLWLVTGYAFLMLAVYGVMMLFFAAPTRIAQPTETQPVVETVA